MVEKKNLLLGICGSPRKQGTEYAVQYALDYAAEKFGFETEFWTVRNKEIKFCLHCDYCIREKKGCVNKEVMDRCRALVAKDPNILKDKIGIALAVGGDRSGGQEIAIRSILDFYQQNHILSVSGGAFGANLGASLWSKDLGKDGIEEDEEGLRTIRKVIKRLVDFKK
jgi:multimeric flavodoxin WrbA